MHGGNYIALYHQIHIYNFYNLVNVRDVKIINSPEWSFISYCCTDVSINDVDIIGNRGNCDGFAICNSHNVTFTNCIAWGGYARCFGITGEVKKNIRYYFPRLCFNLPWRYLG